MLWPASINCSAGGCAAARLPPAAAGACGAASAGGGADTAPAPPASNSDSTCRTACTPAISAGACTGPVCQQAWPPPPQRLGAHAPSAPGWACMQSPPLATEERN